MAVAITRPKPVPLSIASVAAATLWLYAPAIGDMVHDWLARDNASHGFLILPIVGYLAWGRRGEILRVYRGGATVSGLCLAAATVALNLIGRWMEIDFLPPLSFVFMLGALIVYFGGWAVLRALAFPFAFTFFMVPWPDLLVETLSFPMQLLSAKYATMLVGIMGVPASRSGVDIHLHSYTFAVGAPCSGMKTLVALLALAALMAYLARGPVWKRSLLFASGVPIALAANVVRIVVILVIATLAGPQAAEGFLHGLSGVFVFVCAGAGLFAGAKSLGLGLATGGPLGETADAPSG